MTVEDGGTQSVSDKILDKFIKELAVEDGMEETSSRLRKIIFENKTVNEKAIREALFGESET